jgi:hypothetical protein
MPSLPSFLLGPSTAHAQAQARAANGPGDLRARSEARNPQTAANAYSWRTKREIGKERSRRGGQDNCNPTSLSGIQRSCPPCQTISYLPYAKYAHKLPRRQYRLPAGPGNATNSAGCPYVAKSLPIDRFSCDNSKTFGSVSAVWPVVREPATRRYSFGQLFRMDTL